MHGLFSGYATLSVTRPPHSARPPWKACTHFPAHTHCVCGTLQRSQYYATRHHTTILGPSVLIEAFQRATSAAPCSFPRAFPAIHDARYGRRRAHLSSQGHPCCLLQAANPTGQRPPATQRLHRPTASLSAAPTWHQLTQAPFGGRPLGQMTGAPTLESSRRRCSLTLLWCVEHVGCRLCTHHPRSIRRRTLRRIAHPPAWPHHPTRTTTVLWCASVPTSWVLPARDQALSTPRGTPSKSRWMSWGGWLRLQGSRY